MKKSIIITVFFSAAVLFFTSLKPNTAQKKNSPPYARESKPKSELENKPKKDIQLKKAKVILESQDWIISLNSLIASGTKEEDVLTFFEGRVISRNLFAKGYPQVRYALSFSREGSVSWEAVAESESGGLASWRGELQGESSMRGILSLQAKNGSLEDFFFELTASNEAREPQRDENAKRQILQKKRRQR